MSSRDTQVVEQATEDGRRTSFMTLVDAATSQLDAKPEHTDVSKQDNLSLVSKESETSSSSSSSGSVSADSTTDVEKKLSFAEQLMSVLDDAAYSDVLQWMPDGKSFTITNPKKFTSEQMPKLFNIRNMSSFVRKLTRWGFSRVHERATMNSDIFKHPQFHKGEHKLCSEIKCTGRTSASSSSSSTLRKSSLQAIQAFNASSARQAMLLPPRNDVGAPLKMSTGALPGTEQAFHGHLPIQGDFEGLLFPRNSLSSVDQHVLAATVETIRRERELAARLAAARTEQLLRLERAQKHLAALGGAAAGSGFPSLY